MPTVEKDLNKRAEQLRRLHIPGRPLILFNVWDAGSAAAVTAAGALAIATSSWSVASANGFPDGERVPLAFVIQNLQRIVGATQLPVTIDLESGYGDAGGVGESVALAIDAGAVGCNLEDSAPDVRLVRSISEQVDRLRLARSASDQQSAGFFINARTDVFLERQSNQSDEELFREACERAAAYAEAGANGIFIPGLTDIGQIERFVLQSPVPVNVMISDGSPSVHALAQSGVSRVSFGPKPYLIATDALEQAAREVVVAHL